MLIISSNFAFSVPTGKSKVTTNAVALPGKMAVTSRKLLGGVWRNKPKLTDIIG